MSCGGKPIRTASKDTFQPRKHRERWALECLRAPPWQHTPSGIGGGEGDGPTLWAFDGAAPQPANEKGGRDGRGGGGGQHNKNSDLLEFFLQRVHTVGPAAICRRQRV